jgi:hypothetical protein
VTVQRIHEPEPYIPPSRRAACSSCGTTIDIQARSTFQLVTGWIQNRSAGGANHIVLPERSPSWMCRPCVDRLKVGADVNQGALFDERRNGD